MDRKAPRILVVDDDRELLETLGEWLSWFGFEVILSDDPLQALEVAKAQAIDLAITDLQMPGMSGIDLLSSLKILDPQLKVIILTGHATLENALATLRQEKAFDFLQKPLRDMERLEGIIKKALAARDAERPGDANGARQLLASLSPQESSILLALAEGLENRAIAERFYLSEKTVRNHLSQVYRKLGVSNRTQAVIRYRSLQSD